MDCTLSVSGNNSMIAYLHSFSLGGGKARRRLNVELIKMQGELLLARIGECLALCGLGGLYVLVCILT